MTSAYGVCFEVGHSTVGMISSSVGLLDRLSGKFADTSMTWSPEILKEVLNDKEVAKRGTWVANTRIDGARMSAYIRASGMAGLHAGALPTLRMSLAIGQGQGSVPLSFGRVSSIKEAGEQQEEDEDEEDTHTTTTTSLQNFRTTMKRLESKVFESSESEKRIEQGGGGGGGKGAGSKGKGKGEEPQKRKTAFQKEESVYLQRRVAHLGLQAQQKTLLSKDTITKDYGVKQLLRDLQQVGFDTKMLMHGTKSPHDLMQDLKSGNSELVLENDLAENGAIRVFKRVHVARILVTAVDPRDKTKYVIVEKRGEKKNDEKTTIPVKKFKSKDSTWEEVARKILVNDLALTDIWVDEHLRYVNGSLNCWVEQEESSAYRGLHNVRVVEQGELILSHPENLFFVLGMPTFSTFKTVEKTADKGLYAMKNHQWNWMAFHEALGIARISTTAASDSTSIASMLPMARASGRNSLDSSTDASRNLLSTSRNMPTLNIPDSSRSTSPIEKNLGDASLALPGPKSLGAKMQYMRAQSAMV